MRTFHCIFDPTVMVSFQETVEREGNVKYLHYAGPRQIACTKAINCAKCGWNPEEEKRRKENGMHLRRGYVSLDNIPADTTHEYWAFKK